mgnify:CR=1 FL=1
MVWTTICDHWGITKVLLLNHDVFAAYLQYDRMSRYLSPPPYKYMYIPGIGNMKLPPLSIAASVCANTRHTTNKTSRSFIFTVLLYRSVLDK